MKTYSAEKLQSVLDEHRRWVESSKQEGCQADLTGVNLAGHNLERVNLSGAILHQADLSGIVANGLILTAAYLVYANLSGARLRGADFTGADLRGANLSNADLRRVNLSHSTVCDANLVGAHFSEVNLTSANLSRADLAACDLRSANLTEADLSGATLTNAKLGPVRPEGSAFMSKWTSSGRGANLNQAILTRADLTGVDLEGASLTGANLYHVIGLRLNWTAICGAQFSPVLPRWRALLCHLFGKNYTDSDCWSIFRQFYSGPRSLTLFFFVVVFALPYVGRAAFYSTASATEQKVIDSWTHQKDHWREPHRAVGGPAAEVIATPFDGAEQFVRRHSQPRPLWQVLLKIDEGRILPSVVAVLLVLYNVGVYWLITAVGPLRDEEERSGWSPAWKDYGYLRWVHRAVTLLFYVSFAAFLGNMFCLLRQTVWVPAGG